MGQATLQVEELAELPLDAAADFLQVWLPLAREALVKGDVVLVFPPAGHDHRSWRLAAVQELAREAAPRRVNAVSGYNREAVGQAIAWLAETPGITGQILAVDGKGAEID